MHRDRGGGTNPAERSRAPRRKQTKVRETIWLTLFAIGTPAAFHRLVPLDSLLYWGSREMRV